MDDDMQAAEVWDLEIEHRLDSYARARLSPDPQATARARARVMREARLQFEAARIAAHMAPAIAIAQRRSPVRRLAMPLLAASMWLGIAVGSISAAQAGGPLYPTRMWIENATLPAAGAARASAELDRLEARLFEAAAAAARGDAGAVQAALDAYSQIADETLASAAGDPALTALLANALAKHQAVLTAVAASLEAKGNPTAAAAVEASIQRAIVHNNAVVERITTRAGQPSSPVGSGGGANGTGSGSGSGGSGTNPGAGSGSGAGSGTGGGSGQGSTGGNGTGGTGATGGNGNEKPDRTPHPNPEPDPSDAAPDHTPRGQGQ